MIADAFDIPIYAEEHEQATLENPTLNLSGMIGKQEVYHADIYVKDGETLELAGFSLKVFLTPGHTKGGCCYCWKDRFSIGKCIRITPFRRRKTDAVTGTDQSISGT